MRLDVLHNATVWNRLPSSFRDGITGALRDVRSTFWQRAGEQLKSNSKYDIPQGWWNAAIKRAIVEWGETQSEYEVTCEVEVAGDDSNHSVRDNSQRLDHRITSNIVDSFIEVEFGNVGSIYRDIHKLLLCHVHQPDPILMLIVPSQDIAKRCDGTTEGGNGVAVILEEVEQYMPGVRIILLEIGDCEQGWLNLANQFEPSEISGNWIWEQDQIGSTESSAAREKQNRFDETWDELNETETLEERLRRIPVRREFTETREFGSILDQVADEDFIDALCGLVCCPECEHYFGWAVGEGGSWQETCHNCGAQYTMDEEATNDASIDHGTPWIVVIEERGGVDLVGSDGSGWAFVDYLDWLGQDSTDLAWEVSGYEAYR